MTETLTIQKDECWWGGCIADAPDMPWNIDSDLRRDLYGNTRGNQAQPLLLSSRGRIVWSDEPFSFSFHGGVLTLHSPRSPIVVAEGGRSLREAFCRASMHFFPPDRQLPDSVLFTQPQYNTRIELGRQQDQQGILAYARDILHHGFPAGVILVEDSWQADYGEWAFHPRRFRNPKQMVRDLHQMGFRVMLSICPFVNPGTESYERLAHRGALLRDAREKPAAMPWWNGVSAILDMTSPAAVGWMKTQLGKLTVQYGIDGFKFDAGNPECFAGDVRTHAPATPNDQTGRWAEIGLDYPLNEYCACWKLGGRRLAQRLQNKKHCWKDLRTRIPEGLVQGMMGYPYTCPDMIGGGEMHPADDGPDAVDQDLVVRSAQCSAFFPMMQFSLAPWRVLDARHLEACRSAVAAHVETGPYIWALAKLASRTGEAIIRHLHYVFPGHGYEECADQFMLGRDLMVAPMLYPLESGRSVRIPPGSWTDDRGEVFTGPAVRDIEVPLQRIPAYRRTIDNQDG